MARTLLLAVLAVAAWPAPARAQDDYVSNDLRISLRDLGGHRIRSALPGQRWRIAGKLAPALAGDPVALLVTRGAHRVLMRTVKVRRVGLHGVGHFATALRVSRPGKVTVTATHEALTAVRKLDVVAAGRGCRSRATVVFNERTAPAVVGGARLRPGVRLAGGARVIVPAGGRLRLARGGAEYVLGEGRAVVACDAVVGETAPVTVVTAPGGQGHARIPGVVVEGHGAVIGGQGHARIPGVVVEGHGAVTGGLDRASVPGVDIVVEEESRALAGGGQVAFTAGRGVVYSTASPASRVNTIKGDVVLVDAGLPRMNTWPFAPSPEQRLAAHVPAFWADGAPCSVGCRPAGAKPGWPLKPFHEAHPLRSGLNELRPANLHIGVDIQAHGHQAVYAIQGGRAHIEDRGSAEQHIRVGDYEYWHVRHAVHENQRVRPFHTRLGTLVPGARHLHVSELRGETYLNPLRPRGRMLRPWADTEPPVIGAVEADVVEVFDPQSLRRTIAYRTPVLAPAAVAWRAFDASGAAITPLVFAYRGSQHYPDSERRKIYARGTVQPTSPDGSVFGWDCFGQWPVCVPHWRYKLPGIPPAAASVAVYAYDWAGNVSVRASPV